MSAITHGAQYTEAVNTNCRDFPDGPVVRTLRFQYGAGGGQQALIPGWETKTLQVVWCSQKKKKKEMVCIHGSMSHSDSQGYTHPQDTNIFNSIHTCNDINTYNVCHKRAYKYTYGDIHIINTWLLCTYIYT